MQLTTKLALLAALGLAFIFTISCDKGDGKTYKTVKIGEQVWMAENLNIDLPDSKCYNNDPANCTKYGRLYNWETAMKACPSGWHLPSQAEWEVLTEAVGGSSTAGKYLKATGGWNDNGNGEDKFGFAALPGSCGKSDGSFCDAGNGIWWRASDLWYYDSGKAHRLHINYDGDGANWSDNDKGLFFSVRCLQDSETAASKPETSAEANITGGLKLLETITDKNGKVQAKFEYDKQNRIVKIDGYSTKAITYADNLVTVEEIDDYSNKTVNKFVINGNTIEVGKETLTINKDGYLINRKIQKNSDGKVWYMYRDMYNQDGGNPRFGTENFLEDYEYKNGNLIGEKVSSDEVLGDVYFYMSKKHRYDSNKSPFSASNTPKWLLPYLVGSYLASKNNIIDSYIDAGDYYSIFAYKYEYDKDGFPTKQTQNDTTITRFTYRGGTKN